MKNALLPVVTVVGLQIPILIGGSVVMEQIFNLPGIGRHLVLAIGRRDYIVIAGLNIFVAVAILLANMIVDLTYAYLDPRIRYE
jgi:peptide/nickel transport system permease protein